jgi:hypothetical protein
MSSTRLQQPGRSKPCSKFMSSKYTLPTGRPLHFFPIWNKWARTRRHLHLCLCNFTCPMHRCHTPVSMTCSQCKPKNHMILIGDYEQNLKIVMNQAKMSTITTAVHFIDHQPSSMIHHTSSMTISVDPCSNIFLLFSSMSTYRHLGSSTITHDNYHKLLSIIHRLSSITYQRCHWRPHQ